MKQVNTQQTNPLPESVMIFGCGYVGTALAESLRKSGVRVGALTRNRERATELRALGLAEVIEADLDSQSWHTQVTGDYQAVVNCVSSAGGGIAGYEKSYVRGQQSILAWCASRKVQRYLYTSSTSVYPQDGGALVDETASTTAAPETGQVLLRAEELLADAGEQFERWYVFRLAGIYGPGRHYLLNSLREGVAVLPGAGDFHLNLIHLEDILSALTQALVVDASSGIYNLADDQPATKEDLVRWLAEQIDVPVPSFDPNLQTGRVARRGGRMPDRVISNQKIREAFDWQPSYTDFRAGYAGLL